MKTTKRLDVWRVRRYFRRMQRAGFTAYGAWRYLQRIDTVAMLDDDQIMRNAVLAHVSYKRLRGKNAISLQVVDGVLTVLTT